MAIKDVQTYIDRHGLVETEDSEAGKPIWRKPGFDGIRGLLEIEEELSRFLRDVLAIEGVRETVDIDPIKAGYYSISALNPNGIIPRGPDLSTLLPG